MLVIVHAPQPHNSTAVTLQSSLLSYMPICAHKISVQSAKESHVYPIIRLPREFRRLAGAAATIRETTHKAHSRSLLCHLKRKNGLKSDLDTEIKKKNLEASGSPIHHRTSIRRCCDRQI